MNAPLLVIETIRKQFGARTVLDIDGLVLHPGHSYALTGDNGAGKTTLLRVIAGLEPAQLARALYCGLALDLCTYPQWLRREVIYVHQHPYLFHTSVKATSTGSAMMIWPRIIALRVNSRCSDPKIPCLDSSR